MNVFSTIYLNTPLPFDNKVGFVQDWIDRKRRRELERVNREIEELKRRGPDFTHHDSNRPSIKTTVVNTSPGRSFLKSPVTIVLLILVLFGLFLYYFTRVSSLEDDYDAKEQEIITLKDRFDQALLQLNKTENELGIKKVVEANLSSQYSDLKRDIDDLENELNYLNDTLAKKDVEISDLNKEMDEKNNYINALKICIKNDTITDKEDCL